MIDRSPPPIRSAGRGSVVILTQLSPASSVRKTPSPAAEEYSPGSFVPTMAYSRRGSLGATAMLTCARSGGSPFVSFFQVLPPSAIDDLRVGRVGGDGGAASILILVKNAVPGAAGIECAIDATLGVRAV